jgi:hypothetical protein
MTLPDLENLVRAGKLKNEPPNQDEFDGLVKLGEAKFKDAQVASLSLERRFELAYGAAHAFVLAALRWHGYRSDLRYIVLLQDMLAATIVVRQRVLGLGATPSQD